MSKPEKIMKKCPTCKGTGKLPWEIAKQLPQPSKNLRCEYCRGKGYVFGKPKK